MTSGVARAFETTSPTRWLAPPTASTLAAAANVDAVGGASHLVGDVVSTALATPDVIVVSFAPTDESSPTSRSELTIAAATSIATSIAVAAGALPQLTPSQT